MSWNNCVDFLITYKIIHIIYVKETNKIVMGGGGDNRIE